MFQIDAKFVDANGNHATMSFHRATWPEGADAELATALKNATDCGLLSLAHTQMVSDDVGTALGDNPYGNAEDKVRLVMRYTDGTTGHTDIGAPRAALVGADKESVDLTASPVAVYVALLNANSVSRGGASGKVIRGYRVRVNRKKESASAES